MGKECLLNAILLKIRHWKLFLHERNEQLLFYGTTTKISRIFQVIVPKNKNEKLH